MDIKRYLKKKYIIVYMGNLGESKFQNGKIYRIVDLNYTKCYIGSTCQSLSRRMAKHREEYKRKKQQQLNKTSSADLFDEFGVENCKIELIEKHPCNDISELRKREGFYIQQAENAVNRAIAGRTPQEYYPIWKQNNIEHLQQYQKQYYQSNKEAMNDYYKEYREANKEQIKQTNREYREKNKEVIRQKEKEIINCCCGSSIQKTEKARHEKTQRHQNYLKTLKSE